MACLKARTAKTGAGVSGGSTTVLSASDSGVSLGVFTRDQHPSRAAYRCHLRWASDPRTSAASLPSGSTDFR